MRGHGLFRCAVILGTMHAACASAQSLAKSAALARALTQGDLQAVRAAVAEARAALGDKAGIARYADVHLPMDETMTRVAVDVSGRPYLIWDVKFSRDKVGEMDTELFREWFQAFAQNAGITLHIANLYGENNHHIAETCYKGLARALRKAVELDPRQAGRVPSTKGSLTG